MAELHPKIRTWLGHPLASDVKRSLIAAATHDEVAKIAVMPDVHLAREVCVGVVIASLSHVFPAAVGGDIGCGMLAAAFDVDASALDHGRETRILGRLARAVPIRRQTTRTVAAAVDPLPPFAQDAARYHLGTLGTGNHFLELQADEDGRLWVMIHSGSRGVGAAVSRTHHVAERGFVAISADSEDGRRYLDDATHAVRYAAQNRSAMLRATARVLEGELGAACAPDTIVDCAHNFVRRELHDGEHYWVHRKGALPAAAGEPGMIPGSMGTASFHVIGRGEPAAMHSASHGAGRVGSRADARRRISVRAFRRSVRGVVYNPRRERALIEEAPDAYKDIRRVMRAQRALVKIIRRLRPLLSHKGA